MEFYNKRENVDLIYLQSWLDIESIPEPCTPELIMELLKADAERKWPESNLGFYWVDRRPGHDLFSHVDRDCRILEIIRTLRIVDNVENIHTEIALNDIPFEILDVPRQIGHPWYQYLAFILVPELAA